MSYNKYASFCFLASILFCLIGISVGTNKFNKTQSVEISGGLDGSVLQRVESSMEHMITWIKNSAHARDSFVGRCVGAVRHLKSAILFIVFSLGVIMTTLKFLTLFVLKGLAIGLTLLVLNVSGLIAKFGISHAYNKHPQKEQDIHVHVHNKKDHPESTYYSHPHSGYEEKGVYSIWDRNMNSPYPYRPNNRRTSIPVNAPDNNRPLTDLERLELLKLYERLGLIQNNNDNELT